MPRPRPPARPWLRHYEPGVPYEAPAFQVPFPSALEAACASVPGAPALAYAGGGCTYSELDARVARVAGAMQRDGVIPGDVVALVMPNCPTLVVGAIAAMRLGAVALVMDPASIRGAAGRADLAEIMAHHRPRALLAGERAWSPAQRALEGLPTPDLMVRVRAAADLPLVVAVMARLRRAWRATGHGGATTMSEEAAAVDWHRWLEGARAPRHLPSIAAGDPAAAFRTGGADTVVLDHHQLVAGAAMLRAWLTDAALAEETWLVAASLGTTYAFTAALGTAMLQQSRVALVPRIAARAVADAVRHLKPGFVVSRPGLAEARLVRRALRERESPDAVRAWLTAARAGGAGATSPTAACTGLAPRVAAGFVACNPVNGLRVPGSAGLPLPGVAARVVDDRGFGLGPGSVGYLEFRSANLPYGDRWLRLASRGWMDEAGFVYLAEPGPMDRWSRAAASTAEITAVDAIGGDGGSGRGVRPGGVPGVPR